MRHQDCLPGTRVKTVANGFYPLTIYGTVTSAAPLIIQAIRKTEGPRPLRNRYYVEVQERDSDRTHWLPTAHLRPAG